MAEAKKTVELVSKDGKRTWSTSNAVEITNLRAQGWQKKAAKDESHPANKAAAGKSTK